MSSSGTPATQRVKEEEEEEAGDEFIKIMVKDTNRFRVIFKMRKTDRLQALFDFFYDNMPTVRRGTGRFFVDDRRLQGWQTPADFNMEDGDEVDVFTDLLGGGRVDFIFVACRSAY
jgi:small ubiquitin-related modifier